MWVVGGEFLHRAPSDNIVTHWGALFMYSGFMGSGQIILADQKDLYNWTFQVPLTPITKVTAMQVTGTRQPLREHAFASPAKIAGILAQVNEAVETVLPAAAAKLKVYLPNPRTRAILFKPIKSNISEAHAQIAALLEREYTAEDREGLGLKGAGELRGVLEAFSE